MAELAWKATSPLPEDLASSRRGLPGTPGVRLEERRGLRLVQVMARRGRWENVAEAGARLWGAAPPAAPQAVFARDAVLVWSGPGQFLALSAGNGTDDPLASLREAFAGAASLSDQSDGRILIRVSGPSARDTLAKVSSLDLHPAVFPVGAAAATTIDHTPVSLWRVADGADGAPVFDLLLFRSFAGSLWERLLASGAEYGVESATAALA